MQIGQTIKGYELQEQIGAGGFGAIYRAYQVTVGREVAIKVILPERASHPDFIRRFEAEAQMIARLENPYIVPLYDYWRDPDGAYIVMRWLRGGSLLDLLKSQGTVSVEETVLIIEQITHALRTAHRNNTVHRDIKPGNILLDEDGNAYLADFGIAKDHALKQGITELNDFIGSPDYLAPEQAHGDPVTAQTDVYSLGVVLYEMLEGQHPFPNVTTVERLFKHLNEPIPPLTQLDERIRDEVNHVIQKSTAKDPSKRYGDVVALSQALRAATGLDRPITSVNVVELLTPREQEVLKLIIDGKTNREISEKLVVEISTVKWYINQIYRKLNVRSRVQAIVKARELDLIISDRFAHSTSVSQLPEPDNPYKGLEAFTPADAQSFFGREKLTKKLLARLDEKVDYQRFLAVIGPSGSGKSSLVKAGLIPALWRGDLDGSDHWYVIDFIPGKRPLDELEVALYRVAGDRSVNLREQLERDSHGLLRVAEIILPDDGSELLITIDQFEEIFTLVEREDERQYFLDLLHHTITDSRSRVRIIVTLRADYYDRPLQYPGFGDLIRNRIETVLPLNAEELERAIGEPAHQVGVSFEEGLVSRIVADVHYQPGALPLLQYALTELFERREGRILTQAAYQAIGKTGGALANRADEMYLEQDEPQQELIRQMFLRLVTLGEGAEDTRRRIERTELLELASESDFMDAVIDLYAESRLLSLDNDPATRQPTVEVAHEAILREWERLRDWLNTSRDDIKQERQVARAADEWQLNNHDLSYLLRGSRLEQVKRWREMSEMALTPLEQQFIDESIADTEARQRLDAERKAREAQLERRSSNFLRGLATVFAMATILAGGLSLVAFNERNQAESARATSDANLVIANQRANESRSLFLASSALEAVRDGDIFLGHALAVEAVQFDNSPDQAYRVLFDITKQNLAKRRLEGHANNATSVAYHPSANLALSGSLDGSVYLWNLTSEEIALRLEGHTGQINELEFMVDGSFAVSASNDNTIILWDLQTGEVVQTFVGHSTNVTSVALSADGKRLLSGSCIEVATDCPSGEVILWDTESGQVITTLRIPRGWVSDIRISPDEEQVVIVTESVVTHWQFNGDQLVQLASPLDLGSDIRAIDFSQDGHSIITSLESASILQIDLLSHNQEVLFALSDSTILLASFSFDLQQMVTVLSDGRMLLLELQEGTVLHEYAKAPSLTRAIAISSSGGHVISTMNDGSLMLWATDSNLEVQRLEGHEQEIWGLDVSSDGQYIVGGGGRYVSGQGVTVKFDPEADNSLIIWDVETNHLIHRLELHENAIFDLVVSPDNRKVVTASTDGTVAVWNLETGDLINHFVDRADRYLAIHPDGMTLVSGRDGMEPIIWNLDTGEIIHTLPAISEFSGPVALNPDGDIVATISLYFLIFWNSETGEEVSRIPIRTNSYEIAFNPNADMVAVSYGVQPGGIHVFDTTTGHELHRVTSITGFSLSFGTAFSPDGQGLLTGWANGTVTRLDVETGHLQVLGAHPRPVWRVNYLPDGTPVSSSLDGTVRTWITNDTLLDWIDQNRYIRPFTCEERIEFQIQPFCETDEQS